MYQTTETEREKFCVALFSKELWSWNYQSLNDTVPFSRMRQIQHLGYVWSVILGSIYFLLYLNLPPWLSLYFKSISELLCRRAVRKSFDFLGELHQGQSKKHWKKTEKEVWQKDVRFGARFLSKPLIIPTCQFLQVVQSLNANYLTPYLTITFCNCFKKFENI